MADPAMEEALSHVADPELRDAIARAHAATVLTPEEQAAEDAAAERQRRKEEARQLRSIAHRAVTRALEGEWGDDVRRAVDQLIHEVRVDVWVLVDWASRVAAGTETTPLEWRAIRGVLARDGVKDALRAADKIIRDAEKERRDGKGAVRT